MSEQYGMGLHLHIISRKQAKALGMAYYFTGKPCKRGGISHRLVSSGTCYCRACSDSIAAYKHRHHKENREDKADYNRQYYKENREVRADYNRKYYKENREEIAGYKHRYNEQNREARSDYMRQYYKENREMRADYNRRYRKENRESIADNKRQYYKENRETIAEWMRRYYKDNPRYSRVSSARRRAAKIQRVIVSACELTHFIEREAYELARERMDQTGVEWHVDHMLPMQGDEVSGFHHWSNLQVIPAALNLAKGNKMMYTEPFEWLKDA